MKSYRKELWFETKQRRELINITGTVAECLRDSGIREGLLLCNAMHITASVFINDDESGLHRDFETWLEGLAPEKRDTLAWVSNYGNPPIDYAAPGVDILSTAKGGGTTTMSGTSMAAPHVAGLLLLGSLRSSGTALGDPDGNGDPLAHY